MLIYFDKTYRDKESNAALASIAAASVGLFTWDRSKISDQELVNETNEILTAFQLKSDPTSVDGNETPSSSNPTSSGQLRRQYKSIDFEEARKFEDKEWQKIFDRKAKPQKISRPFCFFVSRLKKSRA